MVSMRKLSSIQADFAEQLAQLTAIEATQDVEVDRVVQEILQDIRRDGDQALLRYTARFDRLNAASVQALEISAADCQGALNGLAPALRTALQSAADRIRAFHSRQIAESWQYTEGDGTTLGQRVNALGRVGLYVPGGRAAYPSSVLMNAIPAKLAGVGDVVMVTPTPDGERNPMVLAAAAIAGVNRVIGIGGAQAIGALAYGTQSIPAVDKIVGPGNAYVAAAKRRVFGEVGIDMIAGPSEIVIICDGSTDPDWIAMDLFSQAEHDELAQAILLSPNAAFLDSVANSIERLLPQLPRRDIVAASLTGRGALIHTRDLAEACEVSNRIAPEHLELSVEEPEKWASRITNAGAMFLGRHSSEALGDYCAGPNHVLPTSRSARFSSPLGVYDFQKRTSMINVSPAGAQTLGKLAQTLALGEGLEAHARAAMMRVNQR
ncbi:MAG: histidinol dehydrogenase [Burkholderiales bacterium]